MQPLSDEIASRKGARMKPQNPHQRDAANFVNVTVKQAFVDLAAEINNDPDCIATVEATEPPKALAEVELTVRDPNLKNTKMTTMFVFSIYVAPHDDMARVSYAVSPGKDGKSGSENGDFTIPGVGLWSEISREQVHDYVRSYFTNALAGHRAQ